MATISAALAIAIQHHQAGRLRTAEEIYRRIIQADPNQADAIHLLGAIAHQTGKHEVAVEYIRRAIAINGNAAAFHNNLGEAHRALGRVSEAVACYRRALELKGNFAEAHINLGNALSDQGRLDEAIDCYRRMLELTPDDAKAHNNLGVALKDQNKLSDAIACYRRALELKPDFAEAYNNLGVALKDQGNLDGAADAYRQALRLRPGYAEALNNLGNALNDQGKPGEAADCCRRALHLKPNYAEALNNLGNAFNAQGNLQDAVDCYRHALELRPNYAEAHNNLGVVQKDQGKLPEAIACYRRALELKPDYAGAHSNLLCALQYCTGVTPAALAEAHAEFDRRHAAPLRDAVARSENLHARHDRLRLGFVSPDLGQHPIGYFLIRVLENLKHEPCETVCYSNRIVKDDLTRRFQAAATQWRDVLDMSDERLAAQIREDRIDILFDMAGHTAGNRLLVFAHKPAPIQVSWVGYVGTTGLSSMDYVLADPYEVPPGGERHFQEQVLRMPESYVCYDPPAYAPAVTPLPALDRGQVTFGCFNNPAKVTPQVIEVWAKILRRLPAARLVLKYKGWNDCEVARRFSEMFAAQAIDPGRVEFLGRSPHRELLAEYNRVDVALDAFPYSGCTTTCEALWMGVPVITCPGETFASRQSLSHISNVGLTETIAHDLDEYVELAVSLASDLQRLAKLRAGLRDRMAASPLCDGQRFATNFMALLQTVWEQAIGSKSP